jgi:cupin 2 domain-containing protein
MSMKEKLKNFFAAGRPVKGAEEFSELYKTSAVRIERIRSHAHSSPDGFWYDQDEDEWVVVLRGAATLEFAGGELVEMNEGDYLLIPRRMRHRIRKTSEETIWLAVHLKEGTRQ